MGWRKVASDMSLLLREVDLIAEAQSHALPNEGYMLDLALANVDIHYNIKSRIIVNLPAAGSSTKQQL